MPFLASSLLIGSGCGQKATWHPLQHKPSDVAVEFPGVVQAGVSDSRPSEEDYTSYRFEAQHPNGDRYSLSLTVDKRAADLADISRHLSDLLNSEVERRYYPQRQVGKDIRLGDEHGIELLDYGTNGARRQRIYRTPHRTIWLTVITKGTADSLTTGDAEQFFASLKIEPIPASGAP